MTTRAAEVRGRLLSLPTGSRIVAGPGCGTPTTLLAILADTAGEEHGLELWSGLQLGPLPFLEAVAEGRLAYRTWHVTRGTRDLIAQGQASFIPLRASEVPAALRRGGIRAALVRVSPPDRAGMVTLGTSASYTWSALHAADVVIGEVDPGMPRTHGCTSVPARAFSALIPSEHPTPLYPSPPRDRIAERIAAHVLELLPPDPVLQMGIGTVPETILRHLARADLGQVRIVGLGTDALVDLFEQGAITASSTADEPPVAAVELMGTRRLLELAAGEPRIGVFPVERYGDPARLRRLDRFVSINSAIEIDLRGQANIEWAGGRQVSGVGGSLDFIEAARGSTGGRRILAISASDGQGRGRIVPHLQDGAPVSLGRQQLEFVVTQHGVADLRGRDEQERALALAAIAAPRDRPGLLAHVAAGGVGGPRCPS